MVDIQAPVDIYKDFVVIQAYKHSIWPVCNNNGK